MIRSACLLATYAVLLCAGAALVLWCLWLAVEIAACATFAWGCSHLLDAVRWLKRGQA